MADGPAIRFRKSTRSGVALDCVIFTQRDGQVFPAKITWDKQAAVESVPDQLTLSAEVAQRLMDDLFDAGIRPTRKPVPSEILAAKDKHIDQMYDLAKLALGKCG